MTARLSRSFPSISACASGVILAYFVSINFFIRTENRGLVRGQVRARLKLERKTKNESVSCVINKYGIQAENMLETDAIKGYEKQAMHAW